MKIKTSEQLIDFLNGELSWRKKELSVLKTNVEITKRKLNQTAIRSGVVLLYAHWEGFLKQATEAYLEFVINKRLKYKDLSLNFVAISAKQKINQFIQTDKATINTQIVEFIYNCDEDRVSLNKEKVINTSNLNSIRLKEMMTSIGLDFSAYDTKSNLIDEQLLKYRNNVAHGEYLTINTNDYLALHKEIHEMLENFKTDIENAALLKLYTR